MSELLPLVAPTFEPPLSLSKSIGKRGELKWIPIGHLYIDPSYQREVLRAGLKNIRKIAEGFNWAYFAPIVVAPRGAKKFAVIDGQHHSLAALCRGDIEQVPCLVTDADYATQARAFSIINGDVTRLSTLHVHRASVAAGDAEAVAIDAVCRAAGVKVAAYAKPKDILQGNETLAIGTLKNAIRRYGKDLVETALRVLIEAGAPEHKLIGKTTIQGLCDALGANPKWVSKRRDVAAAISAKGIDRIHKDAWRAVTEDGGREYSHFSKAIIRIVTAKLGDGSEPKPSKTSSAPAGKTKQAKGDEIAREQDVIRASRASGPAPKRREIGPSESDLIAAHLAKKGVRKFDSAATGDPYHLIEWLKRECRRDAKRRSSAGSGGRPFEVDGKAIDAPTFLAIVNAERKKRKLEPLTLDKAA